MRARAYWLEVLRIGEGGVGKVRSKCWSKTKHLAPPCKKSDRYTYSVVASRFQRKYDPPVTKLFVILFFTQSCYHLSFLCSNNVVSSMGIYDTFLRLEMEFLLSEWKTELTSGSLQKLFYLSAASLA